MKTVLGFITTMMLSLSAFAVNYKTQADAVADLHRYSAADAKKGEEHIADMIVKVDAAVQFAVSHKAPSPLLAEIVRVSAIAIKNDPTNAVADVLVPLYKKYPKDLQEAVKALPKSEGDLLLKAIKDSAREQDSGNG